MKKLLRAILALITVSFIVAPYGAFAQSSDWVETLGARMRVHVERPPDGAAWRAVLDIQLEEGWNSYWLDPGPNGIPPHIKVLNASGAKIKSDIIYQAPKKLGYGKSLYAGYNNRFALGIVPESETAFPDKIDVFLGLCSKICVPFQAQFDLEASVSESQQKLSNFYVLKAFDKMPADLGNIQAETASNNVTLTFPVQTEKDYTLIVSELKGWVLRDITQIADDGEMVSFSAKIASRGAENIASAFSLVSKDRSAQYSGRVEFPPLPN